MKVDFSWSLSAQFIDRPDGADVIISGDEEGSRELEPFDVFLQQPTTFFGDVTDGAYQPYGATSHDFIQPTVCLSPRVGMEEFSYHGRDYVFWYINRILWLFVDSGLQGVICIAWQNEGPSRSLPKLRLRVVSVTISICKSLTF
jgi:hypothetical protein